MKQIQFKNVKFGEIFYDHVYPNIPYSKLIRCLTITDNENNTWNAVCLDTGDFILYDDADKVKKI